MVEFGWFYLLAGLSVDGDIQGVQRLYGALSAHMWPGMVMKSGESISVVPIIKNEGKMTCH